MNNEPAPLTSYSEEQRKTAVQKFRIIEPYLIGEKNLNTIVGENGFAKRTLHYWIKAYELYGLCGLIRQKRCDANHFKLEKEVVSEVEQLIYKYPKNSLTSIHGKVCSICEEKLWGFAHEFQKLSKDELHHILEYKWDELGISIKKENFSDYESLTSIMKVTNGNFRLIHRLFTQIERILEINHLTSITTEVVEAARNSLVIGRK